MSFPVSPSLQVHETPGLPKLDYEISIGGINSYNGSRDVKTGSNTVPLEILKQIQQSRGTIKVSLTYQSQCSGITYQDAL